MARPPRNELAVKELAARVARLHKQHPATAKDVELWSYRHLGFRVSNESIRKAFAGQIDPAQCSAELLITLAAFFEVSPEELGRFAAERVAPFLAYAAANPGPEGGGDLANAASRCTAQRSPFELATVVPIYSQPALDDLEEAA